MYFKTSTFIVLCMGKTEKEIKTFHYLENSNTYFKIEARPRSGQSGLFPQPCPGIPFYPFLGKNPCSTPMIALWICINTR